MSRSASAVRGALLALSLLCLSAAAHAETLDLVGTWYVLVHYKDDNAGNPDLERWTDRVWTFEKSGRRLRWTEYPIVVFEDETGRFERRHTGQYARIMHSWEPNAEQLRNIREGLQVNSRGSKTKTLRGSDATGWSSGRSSRAMSATVVTYEEVWSVEDVTDLPVFRRSDFMGRGGDGMEGMTEYATTRIEDGVLSGTFQRDGTRRGTFRMLRAGDTRAVEGAATQAELQKKQQRQVLERMMEQGLTEEEVFGEVVDGSSDAPGGGAGSSLPRAGMSLADTVRSLREPPGGGRKAALLRKLEVLRLGPDGQTEELSPEAVEDGSSEADGGNFAVLALRSCRDAVGFGERTSWYLLVGGSLSAWDHYEFGEQCAAYNDFKPAHAEHAPLERIATRRAEAGFPLNKGDDRFFLYRKGLAYAQAGRIDAARRQLELGDEAVSGDTAMKSSTTKIRSRLVNRSDTDSMRERLVHAIGAAEEVGATESSPAE